MGGADIVMESIALIAQNPLISWRVVGQREGDNLLSMVTTPIVGLPVRQGVPWLTLVMHHHEKGIPLSLDIESHRGFRRGKHALTRDGTDSAAGQIKALFAREHVPSFGAGMRMDQNVRIRR